MDLVPEIQVSKYIYEVQQEMTNILLILGFIIKL